MSQKPIGSTKRVRRIIFAAFTFAAILLLLNFILLDGLSGTLVVAFKGDSTLFASGYSDSAFRRVNPGQTAQEVTSLLGEPLRRVQEPTESGKSYEYWDYSQNDNGAIHRVRRIEFRNGVVSEKYAHIDID